MFRTQEINAIPSIRHPSTMQKIH